MQISAQESYSHESEAETRRDMGRTDFPLTAKMPSEAFSHFSIIGIVMDIQSEL
jgi:hypothetical protein